MSGFAQLLPITFILAVSILTALLLGFIIYCWMRNRSEKKRVVTQKKIEELIVDTILHPDKLDSFKIPHPHCQFEQLLLSCESFDRRLTDPIWQQIKEIILKRYMLPHAQKLSKSSSWVKREWAARFWNQNLSYADDLTMLRLSNDSHYLVRVAAINCIIRAGKFKLLQNIANRLKEDSYIQSQPYRDAFISGGEELFKAMESQLKDMQDHGIASIYLDILSTRSLHNNYFAALPYLSSTHKPCRLSALKILGNTPGKASLEQLKECLADPDWEIRAEATKSLGNLLDPNSLELLKAALMDDAWQVKLQAALALKRLGTEGIKVLLLQDPKQAPHTYEIAQYALHRPK